MTSLLNDSTRGAFECVVEVGMREWPPGGSYTTTDDGLVHLFYVLDGILSCQRSTHLTRVLPREMLRIGSADERQLENPSRSGTTTAIQLSLIPERNGNLSTRHHYFPDDTKDNKLCHVAASEKNGIVLATHTPIDVYLTTLGRYDTLLVDRLPTQPLLILCVRGKATINMAPVSAGDEAVSIDGDTATITGMGPCTVMTIRGRGAHKS